MYIYINPVPIPPSKYQREQPMQLRGGAYVVPILYVHNDVPKFQEQSLKEIMDQEENIVRDTQSLHSDMQTLVYENYNKFISATDTIRKVGKYPSYYSILEIILPQAQAQAQVLMPSICQERVLREMGISLTDSGECIFFTGITGFLL